jgi:hypothetical protein
VNTHFISRFLTKPWEHGQRKLSILDLDAGRLLPPASSESAFAIDGLFSEAMERWFDRAFESPLADWRARLLRGENPRASWRIYRAMVLAILWAGPRVVAARSIAQQTDPDAVLQQPFDDGAIDQLVAVVERESRLIMVPTPPRVPLFFPESAIFGLLVPDGSPATGLGYGFFLPLHPNLALGLVPRGADIDVLRDRWIRDGTLQNASAGHPKKCRRLVVAPTVITLAATDLLDAATRAQSQTASIFADHERARSLVDQMYAIAGMPSPASTKRSRA